MADMEVIVGRQDREHCASITCMIRHYVARRAQVNRRFTHIMPRLIRGLATLAAR